MRAKLVKTEQPASLAEKSLMLGMAQVDGIVTLLTNLKSPQGLKLPSDFTTMCSGDALTDPGSLNLLKVLLCRSKLGRVQLSEQ